MIINILTMKMRILSPFRILLLLTAITLFKSCVPPDYGKEKYEGIAIDFSDKEIQTIYNLQEKQSVDSLLLFLGHENPTHRYVAAMAFAALKDNKAVDSLSRRLKDDFIDVRVAAAYALGQIGDAKAESLLMNAYESQDTAGVYAKFNATIMEAVGKCGTAKGLSNLCNITTFKMSDTMLLEGQAYGIYRYGMRDTFTAESHKKMISFIENVQYPHNVRLMAANYFARLKSKFDTTVTNPIGRSALIEKNNDVRMALARALGKAYNPLFVLPTVESLYRQETDYRVKVNLINSLNDFDYKKIQPLILTALKERNVNVANTAAQYLSNHGSGADAPYYKTASSNTDLALSTRQLMMGVALKWLQFYPRQRDSMNLAMQNAYKNNQNAYEKARILRGIGEYGWNYNFIKNEALNAANAPVVRTTAAECIAKITTSPTFFSTFKNYSVGVKKELKSILFSLVRTGDAGLAAVAADAIRDPNAQLNRLMMRDSVSILYQVMQNLKMPQEIETYESIRQTINFIQDSAAIAKKKSTNQRIVDWNIVSSLTDISSATIKTTKGEIKMRLLVRNAPISVANFVSLSRSGFFNGKIFHRIVPNFVAQTGCPRGDGYGSLDYTISSELTPMHYDTEGYVGMASAGNHTECSQWFITYSPTPHLDPNYSIFAKVTEGMDVANKLEVGDAIESVTIN